MSNNRDYQVDVLGFEPREREFLAADYIGSEETQLDGAHTEAREFAHSLSGDWDLVSVWKDHSDGRGSRPAGYRVEWAEPASERFAVKPTGEQWAIWDRLFETWFDNSVGITTFPTRAEAEDMMVKIRAGFEASGLVVTL